MGDDDPRGATVKRFPTWGDASQLIDVLDVTPDGDHRYRSLARPSHLRTVVEGSQMLGQAIVAAARHRPGRRAVSGHMVFMRAADAAQPLSFDLDELSDGRSFTTVTIGATQAGRQCATATLLLDATAPDLIRHAAASPDVPGPYDCTPFDMSVTGRDVRVVDQAYTDDPESPVGPPVIDAWVRFREVPDDPALHAALLAQFTGHMSIAAALRPHHGVGQLEAHRTISTAINAIGLSLHAEIRADRWMLYHHVSTFAGDGMSRSECRVHGTGWFASCILLGGRHDPGLRYHDRTTGLQENAVSLTTGRGPLSAHPAGRFNTTLPEGLVYMEPFPRRVRGISAGRTVLDCERAMLVHRPGGPPAYAFPSADASGVTSEAVPEASGYVRVAWNAVDSWFEEEEEVFMHPRNPYHRVDCMSTTRRLRVESHGVTLVDNAETTGVYETSLPPLLYVRREHCAGVVLTPSATTTYCPYKGTATYWSALIDGHHEPDIAWSYEAPHPECSAMEGLLCFDGAKVRVDAELPPWP